MLVGGIISVVLGAILAIVGIVSNNSLEMQLISFLSSGNENPGTPLIIIGVILVVIGIVLVILGVKKKNK